MSTIDLIGWLMIWSGAAIACAATIGMVITLPMPEWHQPSWAPSEMTISEMVDRLEQEEAADNESLTLHESLILLSGNPLPYHHPTITTEGTITNV